MMADKDIIVFSDDWGRHPSSCQHLVGQLLDANRIIWVNTIGMRSPQISIYDIKRCFQILKSWVKSSDESYCHLHENLTIVRPILIPYNNLSFVRKFNKFSVRQAIRSIMKKKNMVNPLVLTTFPCTCDYLGLFDESLGVYYCVDDFVNWPGVDASLIGRMEDELIRKSDLVLATAEALCDAKEKAGVRPSLLAHGVDFKHFNSCVGSRDWPLEFQEIHKPIVGFFGAISAWLDFNLILNLAKERPQWSFVFVGPVDVDISELSASTNIHLIGMVSYDKLPRYAACFDVGIIPFQINDLTNSVNPLKLFEYLSLGMPVVSSYMPEVAKYAEFVSLCRDEKEFLAAIDVALAKDSMVHRQQRIDFAHSHSWHSVAERLSSLVEDVERKKWVRDSRKTKT